MANATYDQKVKIITYRQDDDRWKNLQLGTDSTIQDTGCALTSCAMLMRKSPSVLWNDGFKSAEVSWINIGTEYGKTFQSKYSGSFSTANLLTVLKTSPAIVGVGGHFVVAYKFVGDIANPKAADFSVFDSARGERLLSDSAYAPASIRYYK